jgi:ElaB/YqjD/DUF883 family membrane-anchored ribosome-binding protein
LELRSSWRVEQLTNVTATKSGCRCNQGAVDQAAQSRSEESAMNVQTDQRTGYSNESKMGSSGRTTGSSASDVSADLETLRADLNTLKDTVTNYVTKRSSDALDSAKKTTSDVADQIGSTASGIASAASEQAKTFASELERMGRNNPLGALAGALLVGVVIGMIGRGGRS